MLIIFSSIVINYLQAGLELLINRHQKKLSQHIHFLVPCNLITQKVYPRIIVFINMQQS